MSRNHHRPTVGQRMRAYELASAQWLYARSIAKDGATHATKGTCDCTGICACGKRIYADGWEVGPTIPLGKAPTCKACAAILAREAAK